MRYSIKTRLWMHAKGYSYLSFAKYICKTIGKNLSENINGKYRQKLLDHGKQSDGPKTTSKIAIKKIGEKTSKLIETPKKQFISPEKRQQTIDNFD